MGEKRHSPSEGGTAGEVAIKDAKSTEKIFTYYGLPISPGGDGKNSAGFDPGRAFGIRN